MQFQISGNRLRVVPAQGREKSFDFPAVAVSIGGRRIEARTPAGEVKRSGRTLSRCFIDGGITFEVKISSGRGDWFFKEVTLKCDGTLPTPDCVELDRQKIPAGGMKRRGYMVSGHMTGRPGAEEEGGGLQPGCGYPVVGKRLFAGVEHPAAFNCVEEKEGVYTLRQHPVWKEGVIRCCRAVTGMGEDPEALFYSYLETIRIPALKKPLVSFCSFWSDPYLGNYEYDVRAGNYTSLVKAFSKLGIRPDVYTLDAGWNDRRSFFEAKENFGGNAGLKKVSGLFRRHGAALSLWVSHNGPMGMDWDFLKSRGIAVGAGESAAYCGDHYGVLMDSELEAALAKRFCELVSPEYGAVHLKIDWDNDCATTPDFAALYPTRDHVREASIDAMIRISRAVRKVKPDVVIRNGWWPSPWWLMSVNQIFLADSGDSEYSTFPALTQRAAAANHRDLMYYIQLRRDGSLVPPDAFDNHEFPHARRNPFSESPGDWSDACMWAVLRGAPYMPFTLQPESLEPWQAESLAETLDFARSSAASLFGPSRMIGGNPNFGEIYGFEHLNRTTGEKWLALRNPSPMPRTYKIEEKAPHLLQLYPCWRRLAPGETVTFGPHEVKLIACTKKREKLPSEGAFMLKRSADGGKALFLPAAARPGVAEIYALPELTALKKEFRQGKNGVEIELGLRIPYRVRGSRLLLKIRGEKLENCVVSLRTSRYPGWEKVSAFTVPVREIPFGTPGCGEKKNPDMTMAPDGRYYAFDIPQGGEIFIAMEINGVSVNKKDISLWYTGMQGPAGEAEKKFRAEGILKKVSVPAHPEGFPLNLRLF